MLLTSKKSFPVFILTLCFFVASYTKPVSASASFPCKGQLTNNEQLICARSELAELDAQIADSFGELTAILQRSAANLVRGDQKNWVWIRQGCGSNYACTQGMMLNRLDQLNGELQQQRAYQRQSSQGQDQVSCGWWAFHACVRSRNKADRALGQIGNRRAVIINTQDYRNFRNGYYCVAVGPFKTRAEARRQVSRYGGNIKNDGECVAQQAGAPGDTRRDARSNRQSSGCLGGQWVGSRCTCPPGTVFDAGQCRAQDHGGVNCAGFGQAYFRGLCVNQCPQGYLNNRGYCERTRR